HAREARPSGQPTDAIRSEGAFRRKPHHEILSHYCSIPPVRISLCRGRQCPRTPLAGRRLARAAADTASVTAKAGPTDTISNAIPSTFRANRRQTNLGDSFATTSSYSPPYSTTSNHSPGRTTSPSLIGCAINSGPAKSVADGNRHRPGWPLYY